MLDEEMREVIKKRRNMHIEDPRHTECYYEIIELLSKNEKETIKFLKGCSED